MVVHVGKIRLSLISKKIVKSFVSHENNFGLYLRPMECHGRCSICEGMVTFSFYNDNSGCIMENSIKKVDGERPNKVCGSSCGESQL